MTTFKDDNERLQAGVPLDEDEGLEDPESFPRQAPMVSVFDAMSALQERWGKKIEAVPTGLRQLNSILCGGLRQGSVIAFAGAAKAGKSALAGQIAFDAAAHGAIVLYASMEMTRDEIISRWIVREIFRGSNPEDRAWPIPYSDVLHGAAFRGECFQEESDNHRGITRLMAAMETVAVTGHQIFVERTPPGTTPNELRGLVERAREHSKQKNPDQNQKPLVVLVVDPVQRFYASGGGTLAGRALENLNSSETERVGMVAQELKQMADDEALNVCVLFTSDTTKDAVKTGASSSTSLRGSYQLNHLATTIFGMHTAPSLGDLSKRLKESGHMDNEKDFQDWAAPFLDERIPSRSDAKTLGARVAWVECSGNRSGPSKNMILNFVPGAMTFVEKDGVPQKSIGRTR